MTKRILITGADGFIGSHVCHTLEDNGQITRRAVWQLLPQHAPAADWFVTGDIGDDPDWTSALIDIDAVIHLAGRAHIRRETSDNSLAEYRRINTTGTLNLAHAAAKASVKRFIFASSIGVLGDRSPNTAPLTENSPVQPVRDYAVSKWEAEQGLHTIAAETGMEIVIIRPPLAYGPGVPANFKALLNWAYRGIPLPLASANNRRSFVGVRNLSSFVTQCITHPDAANKTFVISDGQELSTPELLRKVAKLLNRPCRLFPVPINILYAGARLLGKSSMAQQLLGNLAVDSSKAQNILDWQPPYTVDEELAYTTIWYKSEIQS